MINSFMFNDARANRLNNGNHVLNIKLSKLMLFIIYVTM